MRHHRAETVVSQPLVLTPKPPAGPGVGSRWAEEQIEKKNGPFRFVLGTRVECFVGDGQWCPGRVVAHYYREEDWEPEFFTPYQVALDIGHLIHAPVDDDSTIRAL